MTKKSNTNSSSIAQNRRARHEYSIEERFEAGLVLEGWEVKSLRASRVQLAESYVIIKNQEAWLIGTHISALTSASSHVHPDATRTRKLLLHRKELSRLIGQTQQKGYTLIPLALFWKKNKVKLDMALAKGKQQHDKRLSEKEQDWKREKRQLFNHNLN